MNGSINLTVRHPSPLEVASDARSWSAETLETIEEIENDDLLQVAYDALHLVDDLADFILTVGGLFNDV